MNGMTVAEAEIHLRARIVAINGKTPYLCHAEEDHADTEMINAPIGGTNVCVFGPMVTSRRLGRRAKPQKTLIGERGWRAKCAIYAFR